MRFATVSIPCLFTFVFILQFSKIFENDIRLRYEVHLSVTHGIKSTQQPQCVISYSSKTAIKCNLCLGGFSEVILLAHKRRTKVVTLDFFCFRTCNNKCIKCYNFTVLIGCTVSLF